MNPLRKRSIEHGFDVPPGITIYGPPSSCSECKEWAIHGHDKDCSKYRLDIRRKLNS